MYGFVVLVGVIFYIGVVGLIFGGGVGWFMCCFGLIIDSLFLVDVVFVDGWLVYVSLDENVDLFWVFRGGGGNFGIVIEFEFELYEF